MQSDRFLGKYKIFLKIYSFFHMCLKVFYNALLANGRQIPSLGRSRPPASASSNIPQHADAGQIAVTFADIHAVDSKELAGRS